MPALTELQRTEGVTLGESARLMLSERLMAGEYAPGEKLSLRSLAETLGVSMTPIREAVSRLVADQALEVSPAKAVRVPVLNVTRFRELTRLRIDIEGVASQRAALARDDADLAAIARYEGAFRREGLKARPDLPKAVALNQKLHFAIYRAAKSPMLVDVIAGLWLKAGPVISLDLRSSPARLKAGAAIKFHAQALAAIQAREPDRAGTAIACDIQGASDFIIARGALPP